MVVSQVDSVTGVPTRYAIRGYGRVVSGRLQVQQISVGDYERYPKFRIDSPNVTEILSVFDSEGNEYYEVENLAQNVIYKQILNLTSGDKNEAPFLLKPVSVPRRYTVEHNYGQTFIQFGHGNDSSNNKNDIIDTRKIALDMHGKDYITDKSFDPTKLLSTDKMGIAPSNTTLTVTFRTNSAANVNASINSLREIKSQRFAFSNPTVLSSTEIETVTNSLEFINEMPITGGTYTTSIDDIKMHAYGSFSAQNRAVTAQDYLTLCYMMPAQFGSVVKAEVMRDDNSFKRNLNIYVLTHNREGFYTIAPQSIKNNLKAWISRYKMINDTIDILDAKVVNIGIEFTAIAEAGFNKNEVLQLAVQKIAKEFNSNAFSIGESLRVSEIYRILKNVDSILDVTEVRFVKKSGSAYSGISYDMLENSSPDGRLIMAPKDGIFEIKFPSSDITGTIL